jgi:hypothetical protein
MTRSQYKNSMYKIYKTIFAKLFEKVENNYIVMIENIKV